MMIRIVAGVATGCLMLSVASSAWAADAPLQSLAKAAVGQPSTSSGEMPQPEDVPPPARPRTAKKNNFFAGPGLGLLLAGAGAGTAVAVSADDNDPASP